MKEKFSKLPLVTKLVLAIVGLAIFAQLTELAGIGSEMALLIKGQSNTYEDIYNNAIEADEEALLGQSEKALQSLAQVQTEATRREFASIAEIVETCSKTAEDIYRNPSSYSSAGNVQPLASSVEGTYSANYLVANNGTLTSEMSSELGRLSNLTDAFADYVKYTDSLGTMYVGTESGILYIYTDGSSFDGTGYIPKERDWYVNAAENPDEIAWTETYTDYYGNTCVTASKAITDGSGDVVAVLAADINFDDMMNQVLADGLGDSGKNFMLSKSGNMVAYEGFGDVGFDSSVDAHFKRTRDLMESLKAADGKAFFATLDGQEVYVVTQEEPTTGWIFCAAIYKDEILENITNLENGTRAIMDEANASTTARLKRFVVYDVIAFLLMCAFAVWVARRLAKTIAAPISNLARGVSKLGAGDFDKTFPVETKDEVGMLASSINRMQGNQKMFIESFRKVVIENERIGSELNVANQIQADMLPRIFPPFPDKDEVDIYATMNPAKEVGGDFYDFFLVDDDHLAFVIADVSGKGVPAALFMVISKTLIKNRTMQGGTPAEILADVNNQLCEGNEAELFVTVWLGILELSSGKIIAANAGHEFPAIRDSEGNFTLMKDKHGFVLAGMEGMKYKDYEFEIEPNGGFFVYTDGVPEATNADNELYGTDRMIEALNIHKGAGSMVFMKDVRDSVAEFVGEAPQFDDTTMVGLVWKGSDTTTSKIVLDADDKELSRLNEFLEENLEKHDCPMDVLMQIQVAAEEIFVNIAHYGYPDESGKVQVTLDFEDDKPETMTLSFLDSGVPFNPLEREDPDVTASAEERGIGGLGIYMVKNTMDDVAYFYEGSKNVLTIKKKLESKKKKKKS